MPRTFDAPICEGRGLSTCILFSPHFLFPLGKLQLPSFRFSSSHGLCCYFLVIPLLAMMRMMLFVLGGADFVFLGIGYHLQCEVVLPCCISPPPTHTSPVVFCLTTSFYEHIFPSGLDYLGIPKTVLSCIFPPPLPRKQIFYTKDFTGLTCGAGN